MHSIPRPTKSNLSVKELESEMTNMNQKRFQYFKLYIRTKARKNLSYGGITKQNPARWSQFKSQVILAFPELKEYEQQWPLEAYFHRFSLFETKNRGTQREQAGSSTLASVAPPKRRQAIFVGNTPQRLRRCHTRMTTDMEHAVLAIPPKVLPICSLTHSINKTTNSHTGGGLLSGLLSARNSARVINAGANSIAQASVRGSYEDNDGSLDYPVPCARCGDVPILALSSNKEITEVLLGVNTLISVLSSLGIVSDHHLSVYRNWGATTFLNSLPAHIINPLHKVALEKYLNGDLAKKHRAVNNEAAFNPVCTTFKALSFPQPSPEHEARIIQATSSEELRKAMGLEDDVAHYILLTKCIDDAIEGMDMQSEQWSRIVNKICDDCPELDNFENTWPISFYVKWKHARICSGRLQNVASREKTAVCSATNLMAVTENFAVASSNSSNSTSSDSSRRISQPKGAPWSGCLAHPLPKTHNASLKLLAYLRAFGMEELLPVFLSVEIKTDDDFDLFSNLDEESRRSVFDLLGNTFRLRPFQRMMLGVVTREAGLTGF